MGAITPIASGLTSLVGTLNTVNQIAGTIQTLSGSNSASEDQALAQLKARQSQQEAQLAQSNALQSQQIALSAAQDEQDRRDALRRAVARQRAKFSASGLSQGSGGSSQAVLLGLFDETESEIADREALDTLRTTALALDETQNRSLNLLQATQLSQRNSLNKLF